jgi:tRNA threonylcarbamoyladenosine biosynthesis protein TsaB
MALILNLETATTNCSVSLANGGELLVLQEENSVQYSHAEQLHVFIEEVLTKAGKKMSDLQAIAVSKGPGSYTGLRIGVSAAKGLCFALNIPLISVPTLLSMAHQHKVDGNTLLVPMLDARRMEVYSIILDAEYNEVRDTQAEIINENSFANYIENNKLLLLGNGAEKCQEHLKHPNFIFSNQTLPSAREMATLSFEKYVKSDFEDVAYFEPYYLKDFMVAPKKKS